METTRLEKVLESYQYRCDRMEDWPSLENVINREITLHTTRLLKDIIEAISSAE